jgi:hypothetical protein
MKTKITLRFLILAFTLTGLVLLSGNSFAQQKSKDQAKAKKTYTIHVTKEVDGNTVVIDTTVVTDGEFDADAFLEEKGVLDENLRGSSNVERRIIIHRPGSHDFRWDNSPDTVGNMDKQEFIFKKDYDLIAPQQPRGGEPFHYKLQVPEDFPPMQNPQFNDMLEDMLRTFGLENVMPFGEMKQVVVKKKRNGKKVIITFEDRKDRVDEHPHSYKKEEKEIIIKHGEQGMAPQNEEHMIINGQPCENVVIRRNIKKTENGDEVIINAEVDKPVPVKKQTTVVFIKDDGTK